CCNSLSEILHEEICNGSETRAQPDKCTSHQFIRRVVPPPSYLIGECHSEDQGKDKRKDHYHSPPLEPGSFADQSPRSIDAAGGIRWARVVPDAVYIRDDMTGFAANEPSLRILLRERHRVHSRLSLDGGKRYPLKPIAIDGRVEHLVAELKSSPHKRGSVRRR